MTTDRLAGTYALITGAAIYFSKSEPAVARVDRLDAWLIAKYEAARGRLRWL